MKIFPPEKVWICASWENLVDRLLGYFLVRYTIPKKKVKEEPTNIYSSYLNINSLCIVEMKGHPQQ